MKKRFDQWLFEEFRMSAEALGLYRIFYALFVLFIFGLPDFSWIGGQPDYYFSPRLFSLAVVFPGFPPKTFFLALNILTALWLILILIGWHTRKASVLFSLTVILAKSFSYAFGKIDHDILLWSLPLFMAFSGWGEAFSVDRAVHQRKYGGPKQTQGWPVAMLAFVLGFGMFTAFLPKLMGGWMSPATQAAQAHHAFNYHVIGRHDFLAEAAMKMSSKWIWEFQDWFTLLFEGAFVFAIWKLSRLRPLLLVTLVFHLMVMLVLNIPFLANLALYALFLPWQDFAKDLKAIPINLPLLPSAGLALLATAVSVWLTWPWSLHGRSAWWDLIVLALALCTGVGVAIHYRFRKTTA